MTDEEKKAIEYFKSNLEMTKEMGKKWGFQEEIKNNEIILNLIEKQQKEIEELKKHQITFTNDYKPIGSNGRRSISEDKIKEKIESVDYSSHSKAERIAMKEVLQSLLEKY